MLNFQSIDRKVFKILFLLIKVIAIGFIIPFIWGFLKNNQFDFLLLLTLLIQLELYMVILELLKREIFIGNFLLFFITYLDFNATKQTAYSFSINSVFTLFLNSLSIIIFLLCILNLAFTIYKIKQNKKRPELPAKLPQKARTLKEKFNKYNLRISVGLLLIFFFLWLWAVQNIHVPSERQSLVPEKVVNIN